MSRLIMSMLMLVVLAIVVGYNASSTTPFAVPGLRLEDASVVAIALVSFVLGVLYSFLLFLLSRFDRRRVERLKNRKKKLSEKEGELHQREEQVEGREKAIDGEDPGRQGIARGFGRLFGRSAKPGRDGEVHGVELAESTIEVTQDTGARKKRRQR